MPRGPPTILARSTPRRPQRRNKSVGDLAPLPETTDYSEARRDLYLVYCDEPSPENGWKIEGSVYRTSDHICLVRTTLGRSRVYHAVKRQMTLPASLMVAPLSDDPKFKGMARGTLTWLRRTQSTSKDPSHNTGRR